MNAQPLALSPAERPAFQYLWQLADPQQTGILRGDTAVAFFAKSKLSPEVLATIWTLADSSNNGFLTPATFSVALRLIGHAQRGEVVTDTLANRPGPPATFEGIQLPVAPGSGVVPPRTGTGFPVAVEIKPEDRARYTRIFASAGPQNGVLDGETAKEIFVRSKLPFDKLGAIWSLADTKSRGALDLTDFIIGMYFIQNTMNGSLNSIPAALPAGLYEQASGGSPAPAPGFSHFQNSAATPASPIRAQTTGGPGSPVPSQLAGIQRQMTGQGSFSPDLGSPTSSVTGGASSRPHIAGLPASSAPMTTSFMQPQRTGMQALQPQLTGMSASAGAGPGALQSPFANAVGGPAAAAPAAQWDVSPTEKANSDRFFEQLDVDRKGELDGQACVPFFLQSKLQEPVLAKIWDLADHRSKGALSKEEFAVAMHLINGLLVGQPLPDALPPTLIPPSSRNQQFPANESKQNDTQRDLFSLMDDDDIPLTSISAASAFAAPTSSAPIGNRTAPQQASLQPQQTGTSIATSVAAAPKSAAPAAASGFDDDFFAGPPTGSPVPISRNFTGGSTGQQQTGYTQAALSTIEQDIDQKKKQRSALETAIAQNATSSAEMESRLSSVKATLESEQTVVTGLEEKKRAQEEELSKLRQELIHEESSLSALKEEKDELEQALLKEREDVRDIKKQMAEVQAQNAQLKADVEKMKKDARQQKGMTAIAKKQLATAEAEHDKTNTELAALQSGEGLEASAGGIEEQIGAHESAAIGGAREAALSPTASIKSSNPFDAFKASGAQAEHAAEAAVAGGIIGAGATAVAHEAKSGAGETTDPFGVSNTAGSAQPISAQTAFDDAFGSFAPVEAAPGPSALDDTVEPLPTAQAPGEAGAAFDDDFGKDIATFDASTSAPPQTSDAVGSNAFDDAFKDLDEPAPKAIQEPTEEPTASAATMPGSLGEEPASSYLAEPVTSAAPTTVTEGAYPTTEHVADYSDDDEEDEGPEDLDGPRRVAAGMSTPTASKETSASAAPQGVTDASADLSTAAFQDPDRTLDVGDYEKEKEVPAAHSAAAPPAFAEPIATDADPEDVPASTRTSVDAFHDADAGEAQPESVHDRFVTAAQPSEDLRTPASGSPATLSHALSTESTSGSALKTRRAPPPAPARISAASAAPSSAPTTAASTAFGDDNFTDAPSTPAEAFAPSAPAAQSANSQPKEAAFDDFESAFVDLGPAVSTQSAANGAAAMGSSTAPSGFDDNAFDTEFSFVPSFPTVSPSKPNVTTTTAPSNGLPGAFDSSSSSVFDDFDSSFAPVTSSGSKAAPSNSGGAGFSFDDAFDPTPRSAAPAAPAVPPRKVETGTSLSAQPAADTTPSPALPDDAGQVKQLTSMGFPRHQVIAALEKSNYRTDRALERLLAGK